MRTIVHPFLTLLASSSRQDLAAQNRLLKAENKILRSKLPGRHVERVIQTIKHEILNGFVIVTNQQLDIILRRGADWYNRKRGHSARDHLPPIRDADSSPAIDLKTTEIECYTELGGLLKSYCPAA